MNLRSGTALTPLIKTALALEIQISKILYRGLIEIGFDDDGFFYLRFRKRGLRTFPIIWIFTFCVVTVGCSWTSCSLILIERLLLRLPMKPETQWSLFNTVIVLLLWAAVFMFIGLYTGLFMYPEPLKLITKVQHIEVQILNKLASTRGHRILQNGRRRHSGPRKSSDFIVGAILITSDLMFFVLPVPVAVVAVISNLDPYYYIFEEFVLSIPFGRSRFEIIFTTIVRLILSAVSTVEVAKVCAQAACGYFVPLLVLLSILRNLPKIANRFAYSTYVKLVLAFAQSKTVIDSSVGGLVFGGQLFIICFAWLVLTCYSIIPTFVYYVLCLLTVVVTLGILVFMTTLSKIPILSELFLAGKRNQFYSTCRHKANYGVYRIWQAQRKLLINCVGFFTLTESIVGVYFGWFIDNLVNGVVLFKPTL